VAALREDGRKLVLIPRIKIPGPLVV
jgi:hypothetical protein